MFPTNISSANDLLLFSCCFRENVWHHLNRFLMLEWETYSLNFDPELMLKIKSQIILLFYLSLLLLSPVPLFFFNKLTPVGAPCFLGPAPPAYMSFHKAEYLLWEEDGVSGPSCLLLVHWPWLVHSAAGVWSIEETALYGWWLPTCVTLQSQQVVQANKSLLLHQSPQTVWGEETLDNTW